MTTISARDFNHDVSAAKRAAAAEPVIITERGRPSHVLLSIDEYERLVGAQPTIVDLLSVEDDIEFETERLDLTVNAAEL